MYEVFYNLKAEPFRLSPDHKFCYEHKGYAKARAYMAYAFKRAEGFVMITGRPGTGKTTLVGELVESLAGDTVRTANLVCTQLQADDLLKTVAFSFGISSKDFDKAELLQRLTMLFQRWHQEGGRALLIVDEAQDLSVSAMEELRLLTNIQIGGQPLVQIFLLGQPELRDLVMAPEMEQVHQRVIAASHLRGLEVDEAEAYVVHRLHAVGWKGDPAIDKAIFPLIHKFSEGVPRRINLICSRLFLLGSVEQRHKIEVADVRDVIGELQAENLAAGTWFSEADFDLTREPEWLEVPGEASASAAKAETSVEPSVAEPAEQLESVAETTDDSVTPGDADAKKKEGLEAQEVKTDFSEEGSADAESAKTETEFEENPHNEHGSATDDSLHASEPTSISDHPAEEAESSTTVDVIEELFEVVTSEEYVDAPEYFDEVDDELSEGYRASGEGQERRYFSGNVIAESALASEEAVSELSSLPENYVADEEGNPLPEFYPEESEAELGDVAGETLGDRAEGYDPDDEDSESDLATMQRDGKEWPLRSKPAESRAKSGGIARFAIAAIALVALVGASLFFVELYVSREDQPVESMAGNGAAASVPGNRGKVSVPLNPEIAEAVYEKPEAGVEIDAAAPEQSGFAADVDEGVTDELVDDSEVLEGGRVAVDDLEAAAVEAEAAEVEAFEADADSSVDPEAGIASDIDSQVGLGNSAGDSDAVAISAPESAATSVAIAASEVEAAATESVRDSSPTQPVVKQVFVVNFDFDSAALGQDASAVLSKAVSKLQEFPGSTATIAKNADGQTPGASAATMAEARAGAVQRYFLSEGVEPARISIESMDSQKLAGTLPGQDFQRTIQVTVSRTLDG